MGPAVAPEWSGRRRGARGKYEFPRTPLGGATMISAPNRRLPRRPAAHHLATCPRVSPPAGPAVLIRFPAALAGCGERFLRDHGPVPQGQNPTSPNSFSPGPCCPQNAPCPPQTDALVHTVSTGSCGQLASGSFHPGRHGFGRRGHRGITEKCLRSASSCNFVAHQHVGTGESARRGLTGEPVAPTGLPSQGIPGPDQALDKSRTSTANPGRAVHL